MQHRVSLLSLVALAVRTTLIAFSVLGATAFGAAAQTCTPADFQKVMEQTGARLRALTTTTQPKFQAAMRRLKQKRGWDGDDGDDKAAELLADSRTADLDAKSARLLAQMDTLANDDKAASEPGCPKLAALEAVSLELQATIRTKSQHVLARIEQATAGADSKAPPTSAPPAAASAPAGIPDLKPTVSANQQQSASANPPPASAPANPKPVPERAATPSATTRPPAAEAPKPKAAPSPAAPARQPAWTTETVARAPAPFPPTAPAPALPAVTQGDDFSRDEIRAASKGFFGTVSKGLATVMEHAFSKLGQPTAYVLGNENGGAFIAGVRYGRGTLFLKNGSQREIYWHGPSIGYDIGATGSKIMFLVYNLKRELDIYTAYSGVDGSAYLVGGVGMTLLTDGKVIMAPIRSGVGVRLGANIGYVRFTGRPTWNPF